MASLKYLVHLDLLQNELQNVRLQQLANAPTSPSPVTGQMYYNTGDNKAYVYNGTGWVDVMQQTSTFTLPEATATVRGGIELFSNTDNPVAPNAVSSTASRTYGLQLNSGGQGVINVPWTDTTYSVGDGGLTTNDFTDSDHSKLDGIASSANNYSHPTGAGNKHIPSGGSSGQFLKYSSSGTAVWASDNDTVYTHPTTAGSKHVPTGGSSGQFLKYSSSGTAVWAADNNTTYSVGDGGLTTNDFTNADHSKLNAIEASADVTDTSNVTSAGALMDTEVTNLAQVKAFDSSDYATDTQGDLADTAHGWGNHASGGYSTATGVENSADVTDTANVKSALNASMGGTMTIGDGSDTITIPGDLTVTGTTTTNNVETVSTSNGVQFEGSAANSNEIMLKAGTVSSDRTITLPDATGTVALTSNITGTNSGTNTGDETKSSIEGLGIQTVGAVTSGSWTATDVAVSHGGTGASSASAARTNLGVAYASDAQALAGSVDTVVLTPGNLAARSYRETIGDASATAYTVNHALGTRDVMVQLYDASTYDTVIAQVVRTDTANITVTFNSAPTDNDIIVLVNRID